MDGYEITTEPLVDVYKALHPLFCEHYQEMADRLARDGITISPFNPRIDAYLNFAAAGMLKTFVVRHKGELCGYANVYLVSDMHCQDLIAREDTIFITKKHRHGIGKELVRYGLAELEKAGARRLTVSAMTDLRVAKLWARMGFKPVATQMIYQFGGH